MSETSQTSVPEKPAVKKGARFAFVGFSLMIHGVLLTLVGGVVIVQQILPRTAPVSFIEPSESVADIPAELPDEPQQEPDPSDVSDKTVAEPAAQAASPVQLLDVIALDSSAAFNVTTGPVVAPTQMTALKAGGGGTSGEPNKAASGPKKFKIFNQEVESSGMGVILDISRTTHLYFPLAVKEIAKNFNNAPTVLVMGCGMNPKAVLKGVEIIPFANLAVATTTQVANPPTIVNQIGVAQSLGKETLATLEKMKASDKVWVLNVPAGQITVTQLAFEKLLKEGVDTIYWFSDFEDKMDPGLVAELQKKMKAKGIKLIAHNFRGKPVPDLVKNVTIATGGSSITVIPGK